MQQTCALLVRARALHFATSVVVLSDIELADQGGRGCPESVGSWIIPSTEVTQTLGKGGGGENVGDRFFLVSFVILSDRVICMCVELIARVHNKHQNHNH